MNKYFIIGSILILFSSFFSSYIITRQNRTINIQKNNIEALKNGLVKFAVNDSINAYRVNQLILTVNEFKRENTELAENFKNLGLSVRKLKTAIKSSQITEFNKYTYVKDSLVTVNDTTYIQISSYKDDWLDYYHRWRNNKTDSIKIEMQSDLNHFIYWDRKGFWPIRFLKRKKFYLVSSSNNPYLSIDSIRMVEIRQ